MDLPYSTQVIERNEDCLHWNLDRKGRFSVQSFMHVWDVGLHSCSLGKVFGVVGSTKGSFVFFFFGTATMNSIPTVDNPVNQRLVLVNRCIMCKGISETVEHLLLHCIIARELWSFCIYSFWGTLGGARLVTWFVDYLERGI